MEKVVEGKRIARIAAISDLHYGINEEGYLTLSEIGEQFAAADKLGADLLVLGGDNTDRANFEKSYDFAQTARTNFSRRIVAIGGNHDNEKTLESLRQVGIEVLDGSTTMMELDGFRIGVFGQNGSLPFQLRESLRGEDWDTVQTPAHQVYTRRHYHPVAEREINALVIQGIDVLIALSHVPLYPQQVTDVVSNPQLKEMTPDTMEYIESLPVRRKIALSGHTHSFKKRQFGRANPVAILESETVVGNIAYPNMVRGEQSPITFIDIYQMEDGELAVIVPQLVSAVRRA